MKKSTVIESISKLPDEITIDDVVEQLIIVEKIERGRAQIKDRRVSTEDEAKAKLSKWFD